MEAKRQPENAVPLTEGKRRERVVSMTATPETKEAVKQQFIESDSRGIRSTGY